MHYCKNREISERVAQLFLDEEVLGFDIEWKSNVAAAEGIAKNVALIQLASERRVALFHVARYSSTNNVDDFAVPTLKRIMESRDIIKVGVAVKGDCTRLRKFLNIDSRGTFELSHLYKLVKFSSGDVKKINKMLVSLAQQVHEHLRLPLWKGEVRSSDWSQDLDYQQIQCKPVLPHRPVPQSYIWSLLDAASDSYAGFQLYHALEAKRRELVPTPPRPAYVELNLPIRLANGQTVATWSEAPPLVEVSSEELSEETSEESSEEPLSDIDVSVEELARPFKNIGIEDATSDEDVARASIRDTEARSTKGSTPETRFPASSSSGLSLSPASSTTSPYHSSKEPPAPCVVRANEWAAKYISSLPPGTKAVASPADLRAYYLWRHERFSASEITSVYQGKQLGLSTVVAYIFNAIRLGDLPFDKGAAWTLVPHGYRPLQGGYKAAIINRYPPTEKLG